MKFKQAIAANVAEHKAKMPPVKEPEEKKEEKISIAPAPAPIKEPSSDEVKVIKANTSKEAAAIISVNLRLAPGMYGEILCTLFPGIKIRVNDSEDPDWYALTYQGRDCYVKKEFIKIL